MLDGGKMTTKIKVAIEKACKIKSLYPIQLQALTVWWFVWGFFAMQGAVHVAIAKLERYSATLVRKTTSIP